MTAAFAAAMGTGVFTFTLPLMNLDEKAGGLWLGSGFAGYFLAKLLIAPLAGTYADRQGIKKPLLAATGLAVLLPLLYLVIPSIQSLYIIQFALGLCAGTVRTVSMTAIGSSMQGEKLPAQFAILAAVMNSSFLLGPLLGGFLYIDKSYLSVLGAMTLFMGTAFILFAFYHPLQTNIAFSQENKRTLAASGESYLYIMLALFGRALGIGSLIAFYPVLIKSGLNLAPGATGLVYSVPSLTTVILLPLCGRLLAGHSRQIVTCSGMLLSSLGLYFVAESTAVGGYIFSGLLMGIGAAISLPASMVICAKLTPHKGRSMGFANMAANLGFMAGPLFCGTIVTFTGNLATPFKLTAISGALLALPLLHRGIYKTGKEKTAHTTVVTIGLLLLIAAVVQLNSPCPANQLQEPSSTVTSLWEPLLTLPC